MTEDDVGWEERMRRARAAFADIAARCRQFLPVMEAEERRARERGLWDDVAKLRDVVTAMRGVIARDEQRAD